MNQFEIEVAAAVQRIIQGDVSQAKATLATFPSGIRDKVVSHFRNTENLRILFPEYVESVTSEAEGDSPIQ
jgi:hypothetical protein